MNSELLPFDFYKKIYKSVLFEYYPVIYDIEVSKGRLTDLHIRLIYRKYYDSPPLDFARAISWSIKGVNIYFGAERPTCSIELCKGDEFVQGTFVEDDYYYTPYF